MILSCLPNLGQKEFQEKMISKGRTCVILDSKDYMPRLAPAESRLKKFRESYLNAIKENIDKNVDYIVVEFNGVHDIMTENDIDFTIVFPADILESKWLEDIKAEKVLNDDVMDSIAMNIIKTIDRIPMPQIQLGYDCKLSDAIH
ncbi:MAG: hypothetical protein [Caudoviricetes sp.]|nr:MAG: hypothetical protein [Caudoviricetes sp.]